MSLWAATICFWLEVLGVTVDEKYMDVNGKFHLNDAGLVAYSHGEYFELGEKLGKFGYSVAKKQAAKPESVTKSANRLAQEKGGIR